MVNLQGKQIHLRAIEPGDLDFLYQLENNTDIWEISGTITPYSKQVLRHYLENAHRDIYDVKQLRLCICKGDKVLGLIDLFDFDPQKGRNLIGCTRGKRAKQGHWRRVDRAFVRIWF